MSTNTNNAGHESSTPAGKLADFDLFNHIETVKVVCDENESVMEVFIFKPAEPGPHPAILLAQHIPVGHTGIENDTFTLTTAQRLARAGYVVAVPFIFHWWPKSAPMDVKREESRDDWMVADMQAGFDVLSRLPEVDNKRIAMMGHCWGGRVAWLAACHNPHFAALAVFYGGNIKKPLGGDHASPLQLAAQISCPVTGFFGNDDTNPSPADVDDYSAALSAAGISHEFYQYDGAGHAFQNFPVADRYKQTASDDAWNKVMDFLAEQLQ